MTASERIPPATILRNYFHAKDENRPQRLLRAFHPEIVLEFRNRSRNIDFPELTQGREAVTGVLVRNFAQTYEDIYTFALSRPATEGLRSACPWLVIMTDKASGCVRVGCGDYEWEADGAAPGLMRRFTIAIDLMQILPPEFRPEAGRWVDALDYPWTSPGAVLASLPAHPDLEPLAAWLAARGA